eukprot:CAMPEP_0113844714 /NCGR_PEP_ID=MMETSP0372-20130328/379_1 /TAXON_ID=340204 /ORGANISM="Lankesteria abbotti" /LENGTH=441 /DNA_ID=CAMNT_0000813725 /DNA_START=94 /DNA_END=1419 /DNA_ORIENTATION=+ /assembly_acc=CAM_ASM_000359
MSVKSIKAREILDSRGNPTIEVDLLTEDGMFRAAVPSGASTGIYEAVELRDKDPARYHGKGVLKAIDNVNKIIGPAIIGKSVTEQATLDKLMVETLDGTQNEWGYSKGKLGANAILAVSMALCRAAAAHKKMPLYQYIATLAGNDTKKMVMPLPCFNVINGGTHGGNKLAMQEFMLMPIGAKNYREAYQMGAECYQSLKMVIKEKYGIDATNVGDEGGFAPNILDNFEALNLVVEAIKKAGHEGKVKIGTDIAASEFYTKDKKYDLDFKTKDNDGSKVVTDDQLIEMFQQFVDKYPVISIEDPFDQDDWDAYVKLTAKMGEAIQIVGDDILVTNTKRIQMGLDKKAMNSLLLKLNQIGSVTECIDACKMAQSNGWGVMVSHRSGETEDTFIADLTVGLRTGQIKTGAPCRSERLAKYNQLSRIEEELADNSVFAGPNFRKP